MAPHRRWLDLVVVIAIGVSAGLIVFVVLDRARPASPALSSGAGAGLSTDERRRLADIAQLKAQYGPGRHSEYFEEWIVRDYFHDQRNGVFVDIGANDYQRGSNTFFLETALGWSGLAVDPQAEFAAGYAAHRPRTKFFPLFVSDHSSDKATVFVVNKNSSQASAFPTKLGSPDSSVESFESRTITLTDLLAIQKVARVDFLNIDVELAEPQVLAGFDIDRVRPRLVCIEAHAEVRQRVLDYFFSHHYTLVGRYLRVDIHNLYFQPLEATAAVPATPLKTSPGTN